jgi:hypothetical protein
MKSLFTPFLSISNPSLPKPSVSSPWSVWLLKHKELLSVPQHWQTGWQDDRMTGWQDDRTTGRQDDRMTDRGSYTVILFSSRYLFLQRAFALHANKRYKFSCKSVLLLHPIESFAIFLSKFVLQGTKITWRWAPIETHSIFVGANRNTQHICV